MGCGWGPIGITVLIVDDDADSRNTVRALVESFGVRGLTASDGEEALQLIRRQPPDLILSDLQMPRVDGFGLVKRLRDEFPERRIPVIAVTGLGTHAAVQATHAAGFDGHVMKPVTRETVTRLLTPILPPPRDAGPA